MKKRISLLLILSSLFIGCGKDDESLNKAKDIKKIEKNYKMLEIQSRGDYKYNNQPITLEEYINIQNLISEIYLKSDLKNFTEEKLSLLQVSLLTNKEQNQKFQKSIQKIVKNEKYKVLNWEMADNSIIVKGDNIITKLTLQPMNDGNIKVLDIKQYTKDNNPLEINKLAYSIISGNLSINEDIKEKFGYSLVGERVNRVLTKDKYGNNVVIKENIAYKNGEKHGIVSLYNVYNDVIKEEKYDLGRLEEVIVYEDNGDVKRKLTYNQDRTLKSLNNYTNKNIVLEIIPEKNIYTSFNEKKEQIGFINIESGLFEEQLENNKIIGKTIDKFSLNKNLKGNTNLFSLKDVYKNLINGVIKIESYTNEKLVAREFYKNGQNIMEYNEWYENGQQKIKGKYVDGKKNDKWQEWNANGQLIKLSDYKNRYVYVKEAYDTGIIKRSYRIDLVDGVYFDSYKEFHKNGELKLEGIFNSSGQKDYKWNEYNEKGQLIKRNSYSNDILIQSEEFDLENKVVRLNKKNFVKEYSYSQSKGYFNENLLLRSYVEKNGEKQGEYTEYYLGDKKNSYRSIKKIVGQYKNDLKDGEWKFYNKNGDLIETKFYVDGRDINEPEEESMDDTIEFYSSGRIKLIDNGVESCTYEDKPIDFKELENRMGTLVNEIDTFKVTEENNGEHFSWQLGDMKLELKGLFLSKNLTAIEKEKLNNLKNILENAHTKAMKFW